MEKQIVISSLLLSLTCALHAQYREIPLPFPDTTRFVEQVRFQVSGEPQFEALPIQARSNFEAISVRENILKNHMNIGWTFRNCACRLQTS